MKKLKTLTALALTVTFAAAPLAGFAAEKKDEKSKAYPLDKCVVSDEKLGEMGKPYVFKHEGREVQLCCKFCLKDFKKDLVKYFKKIEEVEVKAKKQVD